MKKAKGFVSYDVKVNCPHCDKSLHLNQYPYTDEDEEYGHAEDHLGLELFGTETKPAKWSGFSIEYRCYGCKQSFELTELEY